MSSDRANFMLAMAAGTTLHGRFEILEVLEGASAVAITYLACDVERGDRVVVKELLPRALASRAGDGLTVRPHSTAEEHALSRCLRRFMREAETLAEMSIPWLPRIRTLFVANGTGYVVTEQEDGQPLDTALAAAGGRFQAERAEAYVSRLLDALQALHGEGMIHGSVHPDNLRVRDEGTPVLFGIGTTRHALGSLHEPMPGFSPIEVYTAKEIGPWTDVYAAGAVLHLLLSGEAPLPAVERAAGGVLALPRPASMEVAPSLARVMMSAMALLPDARLHSSAEFKRRLEAALAASPAEIAFHAEDRVLPAPQPAPGVTTTLTVLAPASPPAVVPEMDLIGFDSDPSAIGTWAGRLRAARRPILGISAGAALAALAFAVTTAGSRAGASPPSSTGPAAPVRPGPAPIVVTPGVISDAPVIPAGGVTRTRPDVRRPPARVVEREIPADAARPTAPSPVQIAPLPAMQVDVPITPPAAAIPLNVVAALRERIAQGTVKAEFGDYAAARNSFTAVLEEVERLEKLHRGSGEIATIRLEAETARQRATRACSTESAILEARGQEVLRCQ